MAQPPKRIVFWSAAAQQDLIEIGAYFDRVAGPDVAAKLLREIAYTADRLGSADPRMFRLRVDLMPGLSGGLRSAQVHPYAIFYRIAPEDKHRDDVEIIRVLHQQRDLPSILSGDNRP
jgi:plasmid stabilization system protein ParE